MTGTCDPFKMSKVVYNASCWDYQDFYIGKTKRRLNDRKTDFMPFYFSFSGGIICGLHRGLFVVGDHLQCT